MLVDSNYCLGKSCGGPLPAWMLFWAFSFSEAGTCDCAPLRFLGVLLFSCVVRKLQLCDDMLYNEQTAPCIGGKAEYERFMMLSLFRNLRQPEKRAWNLKPMDLVVSMCLSL